MKAFLIQARLTSTRLPGKIMLPFYEGKSILDLIIDKLAVFSDVKTIVATSNDSKNDILFDYLAKRKVNIYRGPEEDVLKRFIEAAEHNGIDEIIRVCSDNPFLDVDAMGELLTYVNSHECEYAAFKVNGKPSIQTHFGFWGEYMTLDTLKKVTNLTPEALYHEHVSNYIYTHSDSFCIKWLKAPHCLLGRSDIRLTIDTRGDFDNVQCIYKELSKDCSCISISKVVSFLDANPKYIEIMKEQINQNVK